VPYRGRFAPSPSGWLHLGNARTALFAWARARLAGGEFIVRVDNLDDARAKPEAVMGNLAELRWLGLDWDEGPDVGGAAGPYLQSERGQRYAEALGRLAAGGHLAESFLSRREVAELAGGSETAGEGLDEGEAGPGPVYGSSHRRLNVTLAASRRATGRRPSLRFLVPAGAVTFEDAVAGPQAFDAERDVGGFVVRRADGQIAYHLAVVVDDAAMGITEVARGADLLSSSAAQLLLYRALNLPEPRFAHVGLLLDAHGQKLSKRHGAASLHELERAGVEPTRVLGLLARSLGWLPEAREITAEEVLGLLARSAGAAAAASEASSASWAGAAGALGTLGALGAVAAEDVHDESHNLARPYRLSAAELAWLGLSPP